MWELLKLVDTWTILALPMVMVCMETSLMEPAWQGFLGRAPFYMSPMQIGTFLSIGLIPYIAVLNIGGFLIGIFGPAIQYVFGAIFSGVGVLFIGPSPWFGGAIPQSQIVVLTGYMLSLVGVALCGPAMTPLALEVFERAGYSQRQVAGASSAMFTVIIGSANFIGPPLGGLLIDQLGSVPMTTSLFAVAVILISSTSLIWVRKYIQPRNKALARFCGCAKEDAPSEPTPAS